MHEDELECTGMPWKLECPVAMLQASRSTTVEGLGFKGLGFRASTVQPLITPMPVPLYNPLYNALEGV